MDHLSTQLHELSAKLQFVVEKNENIFLDLKTKCEINDQKVVHQTAVIDVYQFRIDGSNQKKPNPFTGFDTCSKDFCGTIATSDFDGKYYFPVKSSCDFLNTTTNKQTNEPVHTFIQSLYDLCKNIPSKVPTIAPYITKFKWSLTQKQFDLRCQWLKTQFTTLQSITACVIAQKKKLLEKYNESPTYIQVVQCSSETRIILIGDLHGSIHTLVRHMYRFAAMNILNITTLNLYPNWKLVFMGDAIDRGVGMVEVFMLIMLLMKQNQDSVYYNRGNHETNLWHEMQSEILSRLNTKKVKTWVEVTFPDIWNYLPCAIVLENKQIDHRTWIAHGAFERRFLTQSIFTKEYSECIIPLNKLPFDIFWSDFSENPVSTRGINMMNFSTKQLTQFLDKNLMNFIVRGHQDMVSNSYLIGSDFNVPEGEYRHGKRVNGIPLDFVCTNMIIKGKNNHEIVKFHSLTGERIFGPIATVQADKHLFLLKDQIFQATVTNKKDASNDFMYVTPCLCLSTNTDIQRDLVCDSFAILRYVS